MNLNESNDLNGTHFFSPMNIRFIFMSVAALQVSAASDTERSVPTNDCERVIYRYCGLSYSLSRCDSSTVKKSPFEECAYYSFMSFLCFKKESGLKIDEQKILPIVYHICSLKNKFQVGKEWRAMVAKGGSCPPQKYFLSLVEDDKAPKPSSSVYETFCPGQITHPTGTVTYHSMCVNYVNSIAQCLFSAGHKSPSSGISEVARVICAERPNIPFSR